MRAESNEFFFPGMGNGQDVTQFQPKHIYTLQWFGLPYELMYPQLVGEIITKSEIEAEKEAEKKAEEEAEEETEEKAEDEAEEDAEEEADNEPVSAKAKGKQRADPDTEEPDDTKQPEEESPKSGQEDNASGQDGQGSDEGGQEGDDGQQVQTGRIFNNNQYDTSVPQPTTGNVLSNVIAFDDTEPQTVDTGALTADTELALAKDRLFNPMAELKSVHEIIFNYHGSQADKERFWQRIKDNGVEVKHLTLYKTDIVPINFGALQSLLSLSIYAQAHVNQRHDLMLDNVRDQVYAALLNNKNLAELYVSHSTSYALTTISKAIVGRSTFKLIVGRADDARESLYYRHKEMIVKASSYEQDPVYLQLARRIHAETVTVYVATAEAYATLNPFFMLHAGFTTVNILRENDKIGPDDVNDTLELVHKKMMCFRYHANPKWQHLTVQTIRDYTVWESLKWIYERIGDIVMRAKHLAYFTVQFMKKSNLAEHKPLAAIATTLCPFRENTEPGIRVNLEENSITCIYPDRLLVK